MENGFVQCFAEVDGRSARIMDYAPGQQLQPHIHDIDEVRDDCRRAAGVTEGHGKPFQLSSSLLLLSRLNSLWQRFEIRGGSVLCTTYPSPDDPASAEVTPRCRHAVTAVSL